MNILIIADFYIYGGGTFSVLEKIIRMHNDMGHKTELLIEKNKTTTQLNFLCKTYKVNITTYPVRKLIFENPLFSIIYELFIYLFYIRNISYDLIFVTNGVCYYFMTLLFFKNPIVLLMNAYPKQGFSLKYKFMYLFPMFMRSNKMIITVSKYAAIQVSKYLGFDNSNIYTIYNSFNPIYLNLNPKYNKNIVFTAGLITADKNPDVWLLVAENVCKYIPETKFIWVGGLTEQIKRMEDKVRIKGLENNVEFIEYTYDIIPYYNESKVYFQPSKNENNSIAVIEAMAAGLPCVVSNVGGMTESVLNNKTGFVCDPNNVSEFSQNIIKVLKNKNLVINMGNKGRDRAKNIFSVKVQKLRFNNLYSNIIKN